MNGFKKPIMLLIVGVLLSVLAIFTEGRIAYVSLPLIIYSIIQFGIRDTPSVLKFYVVLFLSVFSAYVLAMIILSIRGGEYWGGLELIGLAIIIVLGTLFGVTRIIKNLIKSRD